MSHDYNSWSGYGVRVVRERKRKYRPFEEEEMTQPAMVYQLLKKKLDESDREMFVIVILNARHYVLGIHTVSVGTLQASLVHPREVFRVVLLMGAASIILAHNHPSGSVLPSQDDLTLTTRLKEAGELLGVEVLDHLIIGDDSFCSLKEEGKVKPKPPNREACRRFFFEPNGCLSLHGRASGRASLALLPTVRSSGAPPLVDYTRCARVHPAP
jgi:DNA repair protein RadC